MTGTMEAAVSGGMTFAKFFPSDWRTGCMVLNLEEEGLYIRVCMFHYDTGRALPDDDARASQLLNVHINKYRKVMGSLIAKGKMIRAQGILFNERVQEEIDRYKAEYAARSLAARKREEARRERIQHELNEYAARKAAEKVTPPVTPHVTPPVTPIVGGGVTPALLGGSPPQSTPQKINEINEIGTTTEAQDNHSSTTNPEARIQKLEKKERILPPQASESDAEGGDGGGHLESLNGTAADLISFISKHASVDRRDAKRMLETNVKTFTSDGMMEAYSVTIANMGSSFIAAPYKYLIETARRIKNSNARKGVPGQEQESSRARIRRFAMEAAAAEDQHKRRMPS